MARYRTGTVNLTNGDTSVVGVTTAWSDQTIKAGDDFYGADGLPYEIATVTNATALELVTPYQGPTVAGASYSVSQRHGTRVAEMLSSVTQLVSTIGTNLATFAAHIASTNNPHGVTRAQLDVQPTNEPRFTGKMGIGTTSPFNELVVSNGGAGGVEIGPANDNNKIVSFDRVAAQYLPIQVYSSSFGFFSYNGTFAGDFTDLGHFRIGTTNIGVDDGMQLYKTGQIYTHSDGQQLVNQLLCYRNGSIVGGIQTDGTSTTFNTTSDHRMKKSAKAPKGWSALDWLEQTTSCLRWYNWKDAPDKSRELGWFAHELAEINPDAVSGKKDAMTTVEFETTPAVYEDVKIPAEIDPKSGVEITPARVDQKLISKAVTGTKKIIDPQSVNLTFMIPEMMAAMAAMRAEYQSDINDLKGEIATLKKLVNKKP